MLDLAHERFHLTIDEVVHRVDDELFGLAERGHQATL
jgi:hypothetical protein